MKYGVTRRTALAAMAPAALLARAEKTRSKAAAPLPQAGEFVRFADPTTETPIVRLTSPAYSNLLPPETNHCVSGRQRILVFSSDRSGSFCPCQADLRTGAIRLVAQAKNLDPNSLTLDSSGRFVYFLDDGSLRRAEISARHPEKASELVVENVTAFGLGLQSELFVIREGTLLRSEGGGFLLMAEGATGPCVPRPRAGGCLFGRVTQKSKDLWFASIAAGGPAAVKVASGPVTNPCWSANGESVLFLRDVQQRNVTISELREAIPGETSERCVAATSQFAAFSPNGDDTVFVGASRSRAQPNVMLLLRSAKRELTLCEHHAREASSVKPVFSPNSQRVYFQSDREGKPAIYSVNVEQLVEPT